MLRLEQTVFGYGGKPIVRCDALEINRGDVIGLVGENGSGKSTLLKGVLGLAETVAGRVRFGTTAIGKLRTSERISAGIAFHPQRGKVFEALSVRDNLRVGHERQHERAPGTFRERLENLASTLPRIAEILDRPGRFLSGGERQITGLGRCMLQNPALMMLDEPSAALDDANREAVVSLLRRLSRGEHQTALLIAEHDAAFLKSVGGTTWEVRDGRIEAFG